MRKTPADGFIRFRNITNLRASEGGTLAYLLQKPDPAGNCYKSDIWLWRAGRETRLTTREDVTAFWWQGEQILYMRREDKTLYRIPTTQPGEAARVMQLEGDISEFAALPEGRSLLLGKERPAQADAACEELTTLPYWRNGEGFTGSGRYRLYLCRKTNDTALTGEDTEVCLLCMAGDKQSAFFTAKQYKAKEPFHDRLYRLDLATMEIGEVGTAGPYVHHALLAAPDGGLYALRTDTSQYGINGHAALLRLWPDEHLLYGEGEYSFGSTVNSDLGAGGEPVLAWLDGRIYLNATRGHRSAVYSISTDGGSLREETPTTGAVPTLCAAGGTLYYTALQENKGPELYALQGGKPKRLTVWNRSLAATQGFQRPHAVQFTNSEGHIVEGWVLPPVCQDETARSVPAVLYIHGGPKSVYGTVSFHELQYLAAEGYAVLYANPTGSDGGGDSFADIRGRYGSIDYEDLMAFVDTALAAFPWLDGGRLAAAGGSYGGFMVNWIIGHTNRFKAAVSQRGIANWVSMATTSDIGYFFVPDQTGAAPLQDHDALWNLSPLKYAAAVTTPTLFIHSVQDYRCPVSESLQMYGALQMQGVPTRMVLFQGENHELSRAGKPQNRLRRLAEIKNWLDTYLK